MLERQFQNDLYYLQARHQERVQIASKARRHAQRSMVKVKDRIYLALGERLINLGQRLKDEVVYSEFIEECCA